MYLPLSLKYRPQTFDEIIGQEHITRTLKNAVSMEKLAHAYLFTGSRGIGKTSTARILAKSLNCQIGPTEKPCNKCTACLEISKGISLDVLEIDGASNRGIDEIRNLREFIKLKPVYGKYRIYIIDEVHMLTVEAFNALLKTLEEPPPHAKFIFATTRAYKVLPTIISRCQRFDFRMIPVPIIVKKLKQIIEREKLDVQEDALFLIAKKADGSLRDAEMMLDQLVSFTKGKITSIDISAMFGTLKQEALIGISEAILNNDGRQLLNLINEFINSGKDAMFIATTLIEHFRNLMVISFCKDSSSHVILSEDEREKLKELAHRFSVEELFYIVYTLQAALDLIARTSLGKIPLEIALLKLSRKEKMVPIGEIMKKIAQLEESLSKGQALPSASEGRPKTEYRSPIAERQKSEAPPDEGQQMRNDKSSITHHPSSLGTSVELDTDTLLQRLKGVWPEIIREVKNRKISAGSYLEEGHLLELKNNKVILGFSKLNSLHKEVLDTKTNKDIIRGVLKQLLEVDLGIDFVSSEVKEKPEEEVLSADIDEEPISPTLKKIEPIIKSAVDIFSGKIIKEDYINKDK